VPVVYIDAHSRLKTLETKIASKPEGGLPSENIKVAPEFDMAGKNPESGQIVR
jgi:hypothetical protein